MISVAMAHDFGGFALDIAFEAPGGITIQPVIANRTVYCITEDADIVAYR